MVSLAGADWWWWLGGGLLGLVGLFLFAWALFWDRSRGRRRCPRCWYDLAGTPGSLTCSECGKTVRREGRLRKIRRRWRWAIVGFVLAVSACATMLYPKASRDGVASIVPTTVLIAALPWLPPHNAFAPLFYGGGRRQPSFAETFRLELDDRIPRGRIAPWQWRWLIIKSMKGDAGRVPPTIEWHQHYGNILESAHDAGMLGVEPFAPDLANLAFAARLKTRDRWPIGLPVRCEFWMTPVWNDRGTGEIWTAQAKGLFGGGRVGEVEQQGLVDAHGHLILRGNTWIWRFRETTVDIGLPTAPSAQGLDVELRASPQPSFVGRIHVPVRLEGTLHEHVSAVRSNEADAQLSTAKAWMFVDRRETAEIAILIKPLLDALTALKDTTLALRLEVMRNQTLVAQSEAWWTLAPQTMNHLSPFGSRVVHVPLSWTSDFRPEAGDDGTWSLVLRGDPEIALRNFNCDRYWAGEVTIPVTLDAR